MADVMVYGPDPERKVDLRLDRYPRSIKAGELVRIGDALTGISVRDTAVGETLTLITLGVARITTAPGATATNTAAGKVIYATEPTASDPAMASNTAGSNVRVGISVSAGAAAGGTIEVALGL